MANYSCTTFGCMTAATGTYSSLNDCNANCVGWGCPSSLAKDANIYFVYDNSGSFNNTQREIARAQVSIYLTGLRADGWYGNYHHIYSTIAWLDTARAVYYHNGSISVNPGAPDNTANTGGNTGQGFDSDFSNMGVPVFPIAQVLTANTVVVTFKNEESTYHDSTSTMQTYFNSWWGNLDVSPLGYPANGDRTDYINVRNEVIVPSANNNFIPGTLKCFLIPTTSGLLQQAQSEQNFAIHSIGMIDSGNQNITSMGGTGTLDGTWISGTSPRLLGLTNGSLPALCKAGDTSLDPVPTWGGNFSQGDGLEYINKPYSHWGDSLSDYGWAYDPTFGSMTSTTLNNLLSGSLGTVAGTATICLSGNAMWSSSVEFPNSAQTDCNIGCFGGGCKNPYGTSGNAMLNFDAAAGADCVGNAVGSTAYNLAGTYGDESCCWDDPYECTYDGCVDCDPDPNCVGVGCCGPNWYNTQASCETGCTSWDCTSSGCTLFNTPGNSAGSGYLGTGGTYTTSGSCTGTCVSYNCGTSGCLEQLGTGGTYSTSATCTASCYSYSCKTTGCEIQVGSGGTFYDITNYQDGLTACTATCYSYECTNSGCVYESGTGGTYASLAACTGACQSWECATTGCQTWNSSFYTTAQSYINAGSISNGLGGNLSGQGGTGGTSTYNACTATCFTWECGTSGCVSSSGNTGTWDYDEEADCNLQCVSYSCGTSGCVGPLAGTGGTYNGAVPLVECELECGSYNCAALTSQPTTSNAWLADSCTYQTGTGGTFYNPVSLALSLTDCQTGCTSWSCQNPFVPAPGGCLEYPNTGNTLTQVDYNSCTAATECKRYDCTPTGCVEGNVLTGTYNDLASCTGACVSYTCTTSGCSFYNETGNTWTGSGHLGTGGTYSDSIACDANCSSWNCTNDGCLIQDGTGGTYTLAIDGATAYLCNSECSSWDCTPTGCQQHNINPSHASYVDGFGGSGGTYSSLTNCQAAPCTSWNCGDNACVSQIGTGGTYSTYNSCTGTCETWNCTPTGCVSQIGTGGTYDSLVECTGGTATNSYLDGCTSWDCGDNGCGYYNAPNYGTGGTYSTSASCSATCVSYNCDNNGCLEQNGTGGTYTTQNNCDISCKSWDCENIGCIEDIGTGGTYTIFADGALAPDCMGICDSWDCTDNNGCEGYNLPGSATNYNGLGGTGGTYLNQTNCDNVCTSWNCDTDDCYQHDGTGGTYTTYNNCTGTCKTWNCGDFGCSYQLGTGGTYNSEIECTGGTAANLYLDGCTSWDCGSSGCNLFNIPNYGTGGTYATENVCTGLCQTYNCTATGCVVAQGSGGQFGSMNACTASCESYNCDINGCIPEPNYGSGGTYSQLIYGVNAIVCNNLCDSWDCLSSGCTQYNTVNGSPSYLDGLGGTGGTYLNSSCDSLCVSFDCKPMGCQPYNVGGAGGTGGTYTTDLICGAACKSWDCATAGCELFNAGEGTGGTYTVQSNCTSTCLSFNCLTTGCVQVAGNAGSWGTLPNCLGGCESWNCSSTGCSQYNVLNSPSYTNGSGGTAGPYATDAACGIECLSWDCTDVGCQPYNVSGSLSNINNNEGTGGTYTVLDWSLASTCLGTCESWECAYEPLNSAPSNSPYYSTNDACTYHIGTANTFTSTTECTDNCNSWTCVGLGSIGCTEFPNTASTFSALTSCTASTVCAYYDCEISGCVLKPGEYTGGIDSYLTETACEAACVGWGCIADTLASGTTIYVYWDMGSLFPGNALTGAASQNEPSSYRTLIENHITATYPNHVGNIYHTLVGDGNWLDWANSIYHNEFRVAPGTGTTTTSQHPSDYYDEEVLKAIWWSNVATISPAQIWYDMYSANTYSNISVTPDITNTSGIIPTLTTRGIAPTAHTSGDTLVITVLGDANGVSTSAAAPYGNINPDVNGYHSGIIATGTIPYMTNQPTTAWTTDYTAHTTNYNAVTAATGTLRGLVVPLFNDNSAPQTVLNSSRMFMLQALASIRPGNNIPENGMYQTGTAPELLPYHGLLVTTGFQHDLSQIENMNPYWNSTTATYGNLEEKGWALDLSTHGNSCAPWQVPAGGGTGIPCGSVGLQTIFDAIDNHLQLTSPVVGTCISAETLNTINTTYPHELEASCTLVCAPQYYSCTTTGCSLSWAGTMTLPECQAVCTSVSCTTSTSIGCETYNSPGSLTYSNGLYGTGGTFTGVNMMSDCQLQCFSYNCDEVTDYLTQNGCQQYLGTGQTYGSYNSCTGSCKSWDCDDPCVVDAYYVSTGLGCVEYINTGATHLTYNACTGVCQENWYVNTGVTTDSCDLLTNSTILSGDIDDHINMMGSTAGWNNLLFQSFKFLYITTPTISTNTCYSGAPANAYWSQVSSVALTLSSNIPVSTIAYSWNEITSFMSTYYPTTIISTMSDVENVGGVTITYDWDLCVCTELPCKIKCTTSTSIPANTLGPYPTHLSASTTACTATTWSCATNTIIDDCDGLTLLPGLFTNAEGCYEFFGSSLSTYGLDFTTFKCEVIPSTNTPLAQCEVGPNYGQLIRLTGITSSITAIASNNYTSLTGYTAALQGISVPNALNGLPLDILQNEVQLVYQASVVHYGWADCECDSPYSCGCVELFDGTGAFTSKTHCELSCCTATTWNCVTNTQYLPICGNKTYLGVANDITSLLEHYRISSPTTLFGLEGWSLLTNPTLSWTQVQDNMILAGSPWVWTDCYNQIGLDYSPKVYLYTISHPLINGGALYQTWDDFYTVVNAVAGITLATSDTIAGINTKINVHFVCTTFNIIFDIKSCCNEDNCHCYDTLDSNGSYASEILCDSSCCPSDILSWSCILDSTSSYGCAYGSYGTPINTSLPSNGPWATVGECQSLSLGGCSTSWKCEGVAPNCVCVEVLGHYVTTGHYQTQWECNNNTNINDCCGLPETYTCNTGTISSNMTGLVAITGITGTTLGFPNLGYITTNDVLTYIANPTTSPSNQNSGITSFSFCLEETSQTILDNLTDNCKCGDGCNGVLNFATGFTFNNFNLGSTDTANAFDIINYPQGYCTTWSSFIDQLNLVWGPGVFLVNLSMTYQQVVDEVQLGVGVSQFGVDLISCVDSSSPCGCVAVFDGSGVSLQDCSSSCCTETTTYTCTVQGCKSRCDNTGEYQTLQQCELECWEWRCNQDIWGCTDPIAINYDPLATIDDGSCVLPNDFWSCGIADDCSSKIDTGAQTLSHVTGQISAIAGNSVWHSVPFDTLKYSLGGGNQQPNPTGLPCDPCEVPGQAWGQPGPYYAYIKYVMCSGLGASQFTSWSSFIDSLNLVLGYSFVYTNSWQDLQAVLGHTQITCVWDWCDCSGARTCIPDNNGNYVTSGQCYADTNNECTSWKCNSEYVESCSGSTTYMGPYTNFDNASNDYVGTYPTFDLSAFTFSVATIALSNTGHWVSVGIPPCTPPVMVPPVPLSMFPLLTFTGITINPNLTLAGSMTQLSFTNWLDLINAINGIALTGLVVNVGMTMTNLLQEISLAGYGGGNLGGLPAISFGWGYCMCGYINCDCVEVPDGTGPYPSMACCEDDEEGCCHVDWDCPGTP